MLDILVYTKKEMLETTYYLANLIPFNKGTRIGKIDSLIISDNFTIKIKPFCENKRGDKSRVILYDGDFTNEDLFNMSCQLIDNRIKLDDKGIFCGTLNETLIAPLSIFKWLVATDVTYINTVGKFEDEEINLVTKDLVKAIKFFEENNGKIYCYEDDKHDGELWSKECNDLSEYKEEYDSYLNLIEFISNQK